MFLNPWLCDNQAASMVILMCSRRMNHYRMWPLPLQPHLPLGVFYSSHTSLPGVSQTCPALPTTGPLPEGNTLSPQICRALSFASFSCLLKCNTLREAILIALCKTEAPPSPFPGFPNPSFIFPPSIYHQVIYNVFSYLLSLSESKNINLRARIMS